MGVVREEKKIIEHHQEEGRQKRGKKIEFMIG